VENHYDSWRAQVEKNVSEENYTACGTRVWFSPGQPSRCETVNFEAIKADYQNGVLTPSSGKPSRQTRSMWVLPQWQCRGCRRQVILARVAVEA